MFLWHLVGPSTLSWTTRGCPSQPREQCLGSSQHPSRSWNTSDPSHQSSIVAISFGNTVSQGQIHPRDRARLDRETPVRRNPGFLMLCLLVTIEDTPVQSRKTVWGQQTEDGTECGTFFWALEDLASLQSWAWVFWCRIYIFPPSLSVQIVCMPLAEYIFVYLFWISTKQ